MTKWTSAERTKALETLVLANRDKQLDSRAYSVSRTSPQLRSIHRRLFRALLLSATLASPLAARAQSPSFDCTKAQTPVELTICATAQLAEQDVMLADSYRKAARENRVSASEQVAWIKQREQLCRSDVPCIFAVTQNRIAQLGGPETAEVGLTTSSPPTNVKGRTVDVRTGALKPTSFEEQYLRLMSQRKYADATEYAQLAGIDPNDIQGEPWYVHILFLENEYENTSSAPFITRLLSEPDLDLDFNYKSRRVGPTSTFPQLIYVCRSFMSEVGRVLNQEGVDGYDRYIDPNAENRIKASADVNAADFKVTLGRLANAGLRQEVLDTIMQNCIGGIYITDNSERPGYALQTYIETAFLTAALEAGANANYAPFFGEGLMSQHNPLWVAVAEGRIEAVKLLLEAGADPSRRATPSNVSDSLRTHFNIFAKIRFATTANSKVFNLKNAKIAALLIDYGADPDEPIRIGATNDAKSFRDVVLNTGELEIIRAALQ